MKNMTVMELVFKRLIAENQEYEWMHQHAIYNSKMQQIEYVISKEDIAEKFETSTQRLWTYLEEFESTGSGWVLSFIKRADLNTFDFEIIRGAKYLTLLTRSRTSTLASISKTTMRNASKGRS